MKKKLICCFKYADILLCILIIIFGIILRFKAYSANLSFWVDEDALIKSALPIFKGETVFWHGLEAEYSPPFLLLFTKFMYKIFNFNETAFRFIPFLASILVLPLFAYLSKKIIGTPFLYLIPLFFIAINNNLIFYSQYFKFYSTDFLISIIIAAAIFTADFKNMNRKKVIIYSVCAALLCWSAYSAIFYFTGICICLFLKILYKLIICRTQLNKKEFVNFIIFALPASVLTIFYYFESVNRRTNYEWLVKAWHDNGNYAPQNISDIFNLISYHTSINNLTNIILLFFIFIFVSGIFILMKKSVLKTVLFISPVPVMLMLGYMDKYPFLDRQTLYLMPIWLIILASAVDFSSWKNLNRRLLFIPAVCFILICYIFNNFDRNYIKDIINNPNYYRMSTAKEFYPYLVKEYKKGGEDKIYSRGRDASLRIYDIYNNLIDFDDVEETKDFNEFLNNTAPGKNIHIYIAEYPYIGNYSVNNYNYIKNNCIILKEIRDNNGIYVKFGKQAD